MIRSWQHIQERAPAAALFYSFLHKCMNSFLIFPSKIRLVKGTHRETLKTIKNFELVSCTCKGVTFFTHAKRIQRGGEDSQEILFFLKVALEHCGVGFLSLLFRSKYSWTQKPQQENRGKNQAKGKERIEKLEGLFCIVHTLINVQA